MSLFKMSFFNLNKPLAPCFLQALYGIALVLIALGLLRGVVGGIHMMSPPPPAVVAQSAPPAPNAAMPAAPPPRAIGGERRYPGMGPRGRRFGRPGFMMGGPLLRGMPPPVLGAARILGALFVAAVATMLVRVLAEIAGAILAMGAKARS